MADLCKKHKFGYEPLRLLFGESCPLCLRENLREVEQKIVNLREHIEFAIGDLPHCPDSAKDFLTHALTGESNE